MTYNVYTRCIECNEPAVRFDGKVNRFYCEVCYFVNNEAEEIEELEKVGYKLQDWINRNAVQRY